MSSFLEARDFILSHRTDYAAAVGGFRWPALTHFNWALDYFDVIAAGNHAPALHVVEENGRETVRSFEELAAGSNRAANYLQSLGARRGDRLLLMLGNDVALWEILLACTKLGVVITPATTLLTAADLQDRVDRGRIRHVVAGAAEVRKLDRLRGGFTRIVVGGETSGWQSYDDHFQASATFAATEPTPADDPLLLYFTWAPPHSRRS